MDEPTNPPEPPSTSSGGDLVIVDEHRYIPPDVKQALDSLQSQCPGPSDMFRERSESLPGDKD